MRVFPIGVENSLDLSIERLHYADARKHRRASKGCDQDQGLHWGLPFRRHVLALRKPLCGHESLTLT